jgi:hypothetical protein
MVLTPNLPARVDFVSTAQSPFIPGTSLQFAWDSTSLGALKKCPRYYQYSIVTGWRSQRESVHLTFGIHFHRAFEYFAHAKAKGLSHDEAVDAAIWQLMIDTWEYVWVEEKDVLAEHADKISRRETDEDGTVWCLVSRGPWTPDDSPKKNRETLIRSVIWYFEDYRNEVAKTIILKDGRPAVELSFRFGSGVYSSNGTEFLLSGHMDALVDFGGDVYVMDHKTTSGAIGAYFFAGFSPDNQMTLYTIAGQIVYDLPISGVIIDAAQVAVGFTSFGRGITMRSKGQLAEWMNDFSNWMKVAEAYADAGEWPMNEASCGNYGGCAFREVCSKDPAVRENYLKTKFTIRKWNPLEAR